MAVFGWSVHLDRSWDRSEVSSSRSQRQRTVYDTLFPPIYQFIYWRTADPIRSRSITAEVFTVLLSSVRTTARRRLLARAVHLARLKIHGERSGQEVSKVGEWILERTDERIGDPLPSIRLERARSALRILSIDQQEVLMFRLAQNLTLQDTASVMGRSIDAVRSLQLRAIEHLAEILDAVEDD